MTTIQLNNVFKILFIFFLSSAMLSCKVKIKNSVDNNVNKYFDKIITLHSESVSTKDFKFVTFIDGSCRYCLEEFQQWKDLICEDSTRVDFIFYFYSESEELYNIYTKEYIDFPVVYDGNKKYLKDNGLDEGTIFTSFLLDHENKVLMVGNPIKNTKVLELYKSVIQNKL